MSEPWLPLSVTTAVLTGASLALVVAPSISHRGYLQRHFFFLVYYAATVVYLQLAPVLSLLTGGAPSQEYVRQYALMQMLCLLLFQVPLLTFYLRWNRKSDPHRGITVNPTGASIISIASLLFGLAFLIVVARNQLWYLRVGHTLANTMVGLSTVDFLVFRSYKESALFLLGVLFFLTHYGYGRTRHLAAVAFGVTLFSFGLTTLLNSRSIVALLCLCLAGWWLATRAVRTQSRIKQLAGVTLAALAALYLVLIVVNVRVIGWEGSVRAEYFNPIGQTVFGDQQGVNRLNCIDLLARLLPEVQREGPAWGAAWHGSTWIIRRFWDPEGFDQFRLSETSAKDYLRSNYTNLQTHDYPSCSATDLFGNFHVAGLLFGAVALAWLLTIVRRSQDAPSSGMGFVLGIFILTHIINFDREAGALLFGWAKRLPVLLPTLACAPFIVQGPLASVRGHTTQLRRFVSQPARRLFATASGAIATPELQRAHRIATSGRRLPLNRPTSVTTASGRWSSR